MILEVVAVTTIHHKMSVKVHLWEISWDEAVYFPHCNPSDGYLFAQTTFTQIIYHGTLQLRGCPVGDISAQQSLLSQGWKTDRCNICPPAVALFAACASSPLLWDAALWGSITVSGNWCSWYLPDISHRARRFWKLICWSVGNMLLKIQLLLCQEKLL